MKLKLYLLICLLYNIFSFGQNFGSFATGIKVKNTIYNTTASGSGNQINPNLGAQFFDGANLGTFGQNSTCAKITGAEVKTFKNTNANVCGVKLNWRVYPVGAPSGGYNMIDLATVSDCNLAANTFNDGFGPCSLNDQKWKDYGLDVDFTTGLSTGDYVLDIFYVLNGSNFNPIGCLEFEFVNNSNNNFKATFRIANPTCAPTASPLTLCEGDTLNLVSNPANGLAPYTFAWTGPNGFTSGLQNPVVTTTTSSSGIYSCVVTDSCGAISAQQSTSSVTVNPKITPEFDALLPFICRNGTPPILSTISSNSISGSWLPSTVSNTISATYVFTPSNGQCANNFSVFITVVNNVVPTFSSLLSSICQNATPPNLGGVSTNGIVGQWNPPTVNNQVTGNNTYTFQPNAGQCATVRTFTINVTPNITPIFSLPNFVCIDGAVPDLPDMSENTPPINGLWSPNSISNINSGTYTFTPATGACAVPYSIFITVRPIDTPTFNPIANACKGKVAPALPSQSTNSPPITGTWNPAVIDTTVSGTFTYSFTPDASFCADSVDVDIIVDEPIVTTVAPIANICKNGSAPTLSTNSTNTPAITGTWSPASIVTSAAGTTDYTFTPDAQFCATTAVISVTIDEQIVPTFTQIAPICQGTQAPNLPNPSNNTPAITGTWAPPAIDTATVGTFVYTFTPANGQCATTTTMSIEITAPNNIPTFTQIAPICQGTQAPNLPSSSTNTPAISGTWAPPAIDTATVGTFVYTFTPANGQCATTTTMSIEITAPNIVPTFTQIAPICQGTQAPSLPNPSNNTPAITGTWAPPAIDTATVGTFVYTFTPANGQCATTTTMSIEITAPNITPTFTQIAPICQGTTAPRLPASSTNTPAINGTWNPPAINTGTVGTFTYTFTPANGQCATTTTMSIEITAPNIVPTFTQIAPICQGTQAPNLPSSSTNTPAITGTWAPPAIDTATVGTFVYTFTPANGQCATTTTMSIEITAPNIVPTFAQIAPICQGIQAPNLPSSSTNTPAITGTWAPPAIDTATVGTFVYTFTPANGQCATTTTMSIEITAPNIVPTFAQIAPICQGIQAPNLPNPSNNTPAITGTWAPPAIDTATVGTFVYTFTPANGQCATTTTMSIEITAPNITPTFTQIAPICQGTQAPSLPNPSNNTPAITGTWAPPAIDTATVGTFVYTFTPVIGQCATTTTMSIEITAPNIVPTFTQIAPICQGTQAPNLPSSSTNTPAITGTWAPPAIDTATVGTFVYTFTPANGQCATTTTMDIQITAPNIIPTFAQIAPICQGTAAPSLPASSTNTPAINGTWNPPAINTGTVGTLVYTFTPANGQCATTTTMSIEITAPNIVPTFTQIAPICQGTTAPILPTSSTNTPAINGTWNSAISTSTVGTFVYTFTPANGQCATTTTMSIEITAPNIVPTFTQIAPICQGTTAPSLPNPSNNTPAINGTWAPPAINTATVGTVTYTFTPANGQCATTTTMSIEITAPNIVPTFAQIAPICQGTTAPSLPNPSNNTPAINGTWSPPSISSSTVGTFTYTFTPANGQCATVTTMSIEITAPNIVPTFTQIQPICQGTQAPNFPTSSTNTPAITGTWNPPAIDTATVGTFTYTFTPANGQCATTTTMSIEITAPNIVPTFAQIAPICQGTQAPSLPTISTNTPAINGTWSPPSISSSTVGTFTYTFTPANGQCATTTTMSIEITAPNIVPTFAQIAPICQGTTAPILPTSSTNTPAINGTWNSAISTSTVGTFVYTFTPANGQCATTTTMSIEITAPNIVPTFTQIAPICQGTTAPSLPNPSNNTPAINGTWSPSPINTGTVGTFVYTFTPANGQCATTTTMSIEITAPNIVPTFAQIPPICQGTQAPSLPNLSNNTPAINGTWAPPSINTGTVGTFTYTFTPANGQCATVTTMNIQITAPNIVPTFAQIPPICQGTTAPSLPNPSNNTPAINGTWNPQAIDTATVGTFVYTFTPANGQCATTTTMDIQITAPNIVPTFTQIPPICQGTTAPNFPTSSTNTPAINGTWNPPAIDTATVGTFVYTFTPANGQCATTTTMSIEITAPNIVPTFTQIPPICQGTTAPNLPNPSNNTPSITGTWNPQAIDTATVGTFVYTFTPTNGQCATTTTMSIEIISRVVTTFNAIASICQGTTAPSLPTSSTNTIAINGTWSPAVINTNVAGIFPYTFTPNSGICATTYTVNITIDAPTPTIFNTITSKICYKSVAPILSATSDNSISGTWSPATVDNTTTRTYVFTPNAGICATTKTITINVIQELFVDVNYECKDASYILTALPTNNSFDSNNVTYLWKDETGSVIPNPNSSILNVSKYSESTTRLESFPLDYNLTITTPEGCFVNQTVTIEDIYCQVQKGISPNGDGLNDSFDLSQMDVSLLELFNRYGTKVYAKSGYKKEWEGQADTGEILPDGTYFYSIRFNSNEVKTGWIYINKQSK